MCHKHTQHNRKVKIAKWKLRTDSRRKSQAKRRDLKWNWLKNNHSWHGSMPWPKRCIKSTKSDSERNSPAPSVYAPWCIAAYNWTVNCDEDAWTLNAEHTHTSTANLLSIQCVIVLCNIIAPFSLSFFLPGLSLHHHSFYHRANPKTSKENETACQA